MTVGFITSQYPYTEVSHTKGNTTRIKKIVETLVKQSIKVVQFLYQIEKNNLLGYLDKCGPKGNKFVIEKLTLQTSNVYNKQYTLLR